jgi:hypothetical protein
MNGLKLGHYFLSNYITFYALYIISSMIFLVTGYIAKLEFFTNTDKGLLVLMFFLWVYAISWH